VAEQGDCEWCGDSRQGGGHQLCDVVLDTPRDCDWCGEDCLDGRHTLCDSALLGLPQELEAEMAKVAGD
jgi:hypothetical protein